MNMFVKQHGDMYHETQVMRDQLTGILTDAELAFTPGGGNPTLGDILKEMGDIQQIYIRSFKTLKHDWSYRNPQAGLAGSVSQLQAWFTQLDAELKTVMEGLTDADLNKTIDRGWPVLVATQLHIYREALLIYYGKIAVYLKAMNKVMPKQWQEWIG